MKKIYFLLVYVVLFVGAIAMDIADTEDRTNFIVEGIILHYDMVYNFSWEDGEIELVPMALEEVYVNFYDTDDNLLRRSFAITDSEGVFRYRESRISKEIIDATVRITVQHRQRLRNIFPYTGGHRVDFIYD
ncbi:MAG: hypothetical protein FWG98_04065 [Candidatus Cloacimonetes bacterium]|nr:hypothetical protein [Candidatus Cloacimonadota bacterium]